MEPCFQGAYILGGYIPSMVKWQSPWRHRYYTMKKSFSTWLQIAMVFRFPRFLGKSPRVLPLCRLYTIPIHYWRWLIIMWLFYILFLLHSNSLYYSGPSVSQFGARGISRENQQHFPLAFEDSSAYGSPSLNALKWVSPQFGHFLSWANKGARLCGYLSGCGPTTSTVSLWDGLEPCVWL